MKDSEFLELLNLYVDHEITREQAARLEAEVTSRPERRKLYRQYCLIHKGCSLLSGAAAEMAPAPARRPRVDVDARRFWSWSGIFAGGGLAAAACLAAFVGLRWRQAPAATVPASVAVAPVSHPAALRSAELPSAELNVALAAPRPASFPSPFGGGQLQTAFNTRAWSSPAVADGAVRANDPLAWIDQVKLTPVAHPGMLIPIDIKDGATLLPLDATATPLNLGPSEPTEVTAFEFQKK